METATNILNSVKNKVSNSTPYGTQKFLSGSKEFLESNTLIAKATFIMLILVIFCILYILVLILFNPSALVINNIFLKFSQGIIKFASITPLFKFLIHSFNALMVYNVLECFFL